MTSILFDGDLLQALTTVFFSLRTFHYYFLTNKVFSKPVLVQY